MVTDGRRAAPSLDQPARLAVLVFSWLLPVGIRSRQRDEWAADLLALAGHGATERCRYLFWVAWTLPALRAAARRGGMAHPGSGSTAVGTPGAVTVLARTILIGLGWPVSAWLVVVPGHYWLKGVLGHELAAESYGWLFWLLSVPMLIGVSGAWAAMLGGPALAGAVGLAAILVGLTQRAVSRQLRVTAGLAGLVAAAFCLSVAYSATYNRLIGSDSETSYSTGAVGVIAVGLGLTTRRLTRRTRVALVLVGLGGVAVLVTQHTAMGSAMRFWFYD